MSITVPTAQQLADPQFYAQQLSLIKGHLLNTQQLYGNVGYTNPSTTNLNGLITVQSTTPSTNPTSGSLTVLGGQGIQGALNVGGITTFFNTTDATALNTGSIQVLGGISVDKTLFANNVTIQGTTYFEGPTLFQNSLSVTSPFLVTNTTDTTTTGGGAVIISGGVNIQKSLYVKNNSVVVGASVVEGAISTAGQFSNINTTDAISTTTGCMQIAGGVGIEKTLWAYNMTASHNLEVLGDAFLYGDLAVQKRIFTLGAQAMHIANKVEGGEASLVFSENPAFQDSVGLTKSTFVLGHNVNNAGSGIFSLYVSNLQRNAFNINGTGDISFSSITTSTSGTTGAMTLAGGLGIAGTINQVTASTGTIASFISSGLTSNNAATLVLGSTTSTINLSYTNNTGSLGLNATTVPAITITSTSVGIYNSTPNASYALDISGTTRTSGTYQTSDARIKKNTSPLSSALSIVNQLEPVSYEYTMSSQKHYGFIAQQVEQILPDIVQQGDGVVPDGDQLVRVKDFRSLNYTSLISYLVGAIQELSSEVEKLKLGQ